jgi:hypothetical protein
MAELPRERIAIPPGKEILSKNAVADDLAAQYLRRMVGLARLLLRREPLDTTIDAEDIASAAIHEMFKAVAGGRARGHAVGNDDWKLASHLVRREVAKHGRRLSCVRRGGSGRNKDADEVRDISQVEIDLELLESRQVSPEDLVAWKLDVERRIEALRDRSLREIVRLMLEGYSEDEIAAKTQQHRLTICRKLQRLRFIWKDLDPGK